MHFLFTQQIKNPKWSNLTTLKIQKRNKLMRLLILIILLTMSSCEKDELIVNGVITLPKITESKKVSKPTLKKKRKFRLFKQRKYRDSKSYLKTDQSND
jgi:hypothetical protein